MTVIAINRVPWNIITIRNVSSITLSNGIYTVVGDTTQTFVAENYIIRIMES